MVSRGDLAASRPEAAEPDLTFTIVRQWRGEEISRAYGIFAMPIGYLIDSGVITLSVAVGTPAILVLADGDAGHGHACHEACTRA